MDNIQAQVMDRRQQLCDELGLINTDDNIVVPYIIGLYRHIKANYSNYQLICDVIDILLSDNRLWLLSNYISSCKSNSYIALCIRSILSNTYTQDPGTQANNMDALYRVLCYHKHRLDAHTR